DSTGVYDLKHPLNKTLPDAMSMPRFFQENGYRTISLGKIYHHSGDDKKYWDVRDTCGTNAYADPETAAEIRRLTREGKQKGLKDKVLRHY
ncbi:MAG: iduronate-2-sulfatase, partial [Pseudomonadota bacterium]